MTTLSERHRQFRRLHDTGCFVIPNPWDMGSARMMAALGARALATTSAGFAFTLGRPDMGRVSRDEALGHAESIVCATPLPVSGDLENGFADAPDEVAETVRLAREAGLSGCSIEDTRMVEGNPAYDFELAVDRIRAAVDTARSLADPFVLCARADGVMNGTYDMDEAIRRIRAYEQAGADLLYVPVVPDAEALKQVVGAVSTPVNALAAGTLAGLTVDEMAAAGVRRISTGSMFARLTHAAIRDAARAVLEHGSFESFSGAAGGSEIDRLLLAGAGPTASRTAGG
ncbi:MAG: isocitrate lyase/phosphoenolpyruvate mutase family protein [Gammaproteobacteria bacterium]|nr:isocitrate lyase/phosphoenolpyruvate mutase family protein [Gammaproteobacteria bacterium]